MAKRAGHGRSQRQLRVGELVRKALSDILRNGEIHHPDVADASITVTEVRLSPDLRNATVFVLPLGGRNAEAALEGLRQCSAFLRGRLAREVELRYAPGLSFLLDESFDQAERVEALLEGAAGAGADSDPGGNGDGEGETPD